MAEQFPRPPLLPRAERLAAGKAFREKLPRSALAQTGAFDRDPNALIEQSSEGRVPRLVPLRYGRMIANPFAFFRGTALLQAVDLASAPSSGLIVQACGDCHLMNFGGYATPERQLVFDMNDFDETAPAPFEWDLKRLATSFVVAARHMRLGDDVGRAAAVKAVQTYGEHMDAFSGWSAIQIWYDHMTLDEIREAMGDARGRGRVDDAVARASKRTHEGLLPKLGDKVDGRWVLRDNLPTVFHVHGATSLLDPDDDWARLGEYGPIVQAFYEEYSGVLSADRLALLARHRLQDIAFKVVGVGSVGTRCLVLLLVDGDDNPLFLQVKQAGTSVLEGRLPGIAPVAHAGQRIVEGQRLMQASSDLFLGWTRGPSGRPFYVRQLRDMKVSAEIEMFDAQSFDVYAWLCGWSLARAHAKGSGRAAEIRGYLGKKGAAAEPLGDYAVAYADQVEKDFDRFAGACRQGRLPVTTEEAFQAGLVA